MTKPLQPIYICTAELCPYPKINPIHSELCDGTLIPHYSLPDLERYLKERLEDTEAEIRDPSNSCRTTDRFVSRKWELEEILKDLKEAK